MEFFAKYIELAISLTLTATGLAFIYGKHTSSVESNTKKNAEQDAELKAQDVKIDSLKNRMIEREDKTRADIAERFDRLDSKIDRVLLELK